MLCVDAGVLPVQSRVRTDCVWNDFVLSVSKQVVASTVHRETVVARRFSLVNCKQPESEVCLCSTYVCTVLKVRSFQMSCRDTCIHGNRQE